MRSHNGIRTNANEVCVRVCVWEILAFEWGEKRAINARMRIDAIKCLPLDVVLLLFWINLNTRWARMNGKRLGRVAFFLHLATYRFCDKISIFLLFITVCYAKGFFWFLVLFLLRWIVRECGIIKCFPTVRKIRCIIVIVKRPACRRWNGMRATSLWFTWESVKAHYDLHWACVEHCLAPVFDFVCRK